jgi:Ca-activated chloride channel homolog
MNEIHLTHPEMLHWLWLVPLLPAFAVYRFYRVDQGLRQFTALEQLPRLIAAVGRGRQWSKIILVCLAACFLVVALVRPGWNPQVEKVQQQGRDIAILLDVSRSMLADDLKPNRLERAKLAIVDLLERIRGDRVALVVFAGTSVLKCPLTHDYGFFKFALEDIGVESVSRGGTMLGDALRKTLDEVFNDHLKRYKDIILITDGEDQGSFPVEAAEEVGKRGIRLIGVGLGDENEGQRIPVVNERGERSFLRYQEKEVWTRLDADTLRKMVDATPGGRYLNVATGTFDLGSIYQNLVATAEKKELESTTIRRYEEKFQIFLGLAVLLLVGEMLLSEQRKRS